MRGVCSGGGAVALAHLGLEDVFDDVYATSAGVMNAAYLLSRQTTVGITVYYQCMVTRELVNPLRLWKIVDIDHLFTTTVVHDRPLNLNRVRSSPSNFRVVAMDRDSAEPMVLDVKRPPELMLATLKAATAMPVLYNRAVQLDGRRYVDGGMLHPFPLEPALNDGCTDLLVLLSRPPSFVRSAPGSFQRFMYDKLFAHGHEGLRRAFARVHERDAELRALALGLTPLTRPANVATICSDEGDSIERLTTNRAALRDAAIRYGRNVLTLMGSPRDDWDLGCPE